MSWPFIFSSFLVAGCEGVNYDFAANFYDLAAKFSRLIFNEIAVIF